MKYTGLQEQISTNNRKSIALLAAFPFLVMALVFIFFIVTNYLNSGVTNAQGYYIQERHLSIDIVIGEFLNALPWVIVIVLVWFLIAYFSNTAIINASTKSHEVTRKDYMRIYNLTENLCMSVGMKMPKLRVIDSPALNAFASGINEKSYTVTLTAGIINKLNDEELEGVIAHELTHIRNKDVRLLIVSIIFVGIFSLVISIILRTFFWGSVLGGSQRRRGKGGGNAMFIIVLVLAAIGYFFSIIFRMALSRKREYLADSGAVEMTKNSMALANALEKISGNDQLEGIKNDDVKQMFISDSEKESVRFSLSNLFATHPPIEKRIKFLRQL